MRLVILCQQSYVNSIADVRVVRLNVPHLKTQLQFMSCCEFWDPFHIMELPASCAATARSRESAVQPVHASEFEDDISMFDFGGGYVMGENCNLMAGYISPPG